MVSDQHIIALIGQDDLKGYEYLFKKYYNLMHLEAMKICKSYEDAEDIVQQLMLHLCQRKLIRPDIQNLGGYLAYAVRNRCYNHLEKTRRLEPILNHFAAGGAPDPLDALSQKELAYFLETHIQALPPKRRRIFEWKYILGLSNKKISEKAGISINTVDNHLARAVKALRQALQGHYLPLFFFLFF